MSDEEYEVRVPESAIKDLADSLTDTVDAADNLITALIESSGFGSLDPRVSTAIFKYMAVRMTYQRIGDSLMKYVPEDIMEELRREREGNKDG